MNKYKEKIKKIEKDFKNDDDNEGYHVLWDELLIEILKENGFEDIANEYEKESQHFWYA